MVRNRLFTALKKTRSNYVPELILVFFLFTSCAQKPILPIYGDIPIDTTISSIDDLLELVSLYNVQNIFFVTKDSIAVEMRVESLGELDLSYVKTSRERMYPFRKVIIAPPMKLAQWGGERGGDNSEQIYPFPTDESSQWNTSSETLPRTGNLKDIHYIAVESDFHDYRLAIFNGVDKQEHISPYQRIKKEFDLVGTSSMNGHQIFKYEYVSPHYHFIYRADTLLTVFKNGHESFFTPAEMHQILSFEMTHWTISGNAGILPAKNNLNTTLQAGCLRSQSIITIIWENYPEDSIQDIHHEIYALNRSNLPVLLILIDGLGWNMVENAKARNRAGFFENLDLLPMRVMYPPRTRTAMNLVEEWLQSSEFGVRSSELRDNMSKQRILTQRRQRIHREHREFSVYSVSSLRNSVLKKKTLLSIQTPIIIQNDRTFLNTDFPIILNTDRNNDGFIDDEIFETAMEYLDKEHDFIFVHFKSIDDVSHAFGPYSENTLQRIEQVSYYVQNLIDAWEGEVIIFSDHGQHNQGFQGNHGINRIEDMVGIKNL